MNTLALRISGAKNWHDKGYTGKGVTIAVLDTFEMSDIVRPFDTSLESTHGLNVCKSALVTAPDANIVMMRWKGRGADKQQCIDWINSNKPDIINVSLGGIIIQARDFEKLEGHTLFCATGNNAKDKPDYPARFDFTLAVGSWNHNLNRIASYSNRGEDVFGLNPYIKNSQGNWWTPMGTSFATPFVSGLMACYVQLLKEQGVTPTTQQIYDFAKANRNEYGFFRLPDTMLEVITTNKPEYIIIHHSATAQGDAEAFRRAHMAKGWRDIGYHYVIGNGTYSGDGLVETGRTEAEDGAHCSADGMNRKSIGICLVGNFDIDKPTPAQMEALRRLCRDIMTRHKIPPFKILGHGEVAGANTACPGKYFDMRRFRAEVLDVEKKDYEGHWAETYIKKAINAGYVTGYPDGSFKPDNPITRAEFCCVLSFIIDKLERK